MNDNPNGKWLLASEVAKRLGRSSLHVRQLSRKGKLEGRDKPLRISTESFNRYLETIAPGTIPGLFYAGKVGKE